VPHHMLLKLSVVYHVRLSPLDDPLRFEIPDSVHIRS
jgi:hypothetical protein